MRRILILSFIILTCLGIRGFAQDSERRFLEDKTIVGKLEWDDIGNFPYGIINKKKSVVIDIEVEEDRKDRKFKNKRIHNLVGRKVRISGPVYLITADTEYKGLEIIDLNRGKGMINEVK